MIIHQTDFQKEMAKVPTKLEVDTIAYQRGLLKDKEEVRAFQRLVAGHQGEQTALNYLKKYGSRDWIVIPNLWMNHFGNFECDLALFTRYKCYPLEVKNYFGDFIFKEGISTLENIQLTVNPIFQARKATSNLKEILHRENISVPIEGSLLFTGVDNYVDIQEEVADLNIVTRNQLRHFVKGILEEEKASVGKAVPWYKIFPLFEKYERKSHFGAKPYSKEMIRQALTGVSCAKCQRFNLEVNKYKATCHCGHEEDRTEALLRTINEYGILTFYQPFSVKEILHFCDYKFSRSYLTKIIGQHFKKINKGRYTLYCFS